MYLIQKRQKTNYIFLVSASLILGLIVLYWLCGFRCLDPTNIAWTGEGDAGQHYVGWLFYRYSDWTFPIGLNPDWGMENAVSIIYADALPFFAIPFKVIQRWLPEPFQYYGIWFLLCFVLSSFFTMRILAEYKAPKIVQIVGAFFAAASPVLLLRIPAHQSLTAHWIIIWALGLALSTRNNLHWCEWAWLLCTSIAVHPYFTFMVIPIFVADGVVRELIPIFMTNNRRRFCIDLMKCITISFLMVITAWQIGLIGLSNTSPSTGGYGYFKSNLNTLLNPMGFSAFLKDWPTNPGEYEGFGYLGLGLILLLVIAITIRSELPKNHKVFKINIAPLTLAISCLILIAISGKISINNYTFNIIDGQQFDILSTFRASGRFIWVLWYFILITSILTLTKSYSINLISFRLLICLLIGTFAIQAIDIHQQNHDTRRLELMTKKSTTFFPIDPKWEDIALSYDKLRVLHNPGNDYSDWRNIAYLAGIHHMQTNTGYWARTKNTAVADAIKRDDEILGTGHFPEKTAYVITKRDIAQITKNTPSDSKLVKLNGLYLLLPHWRGAELPSNWPKLSDLIFTPALDRDYFVNDIDIDGAKLLSSGWSNQEPWGTWSNGNKASIIFIIPDHASELVLTAHPFITENHKSQRVIIKTKKDVIVFDDVMKTRNDIRIPLDDRVMENIQNLAIAELSFEFPDAASPASVGFNGDERVLGLGLEHWKIVSKY